MRIAAAVAIVVSVLTASWYFAMRDTTAEREQVSAADVEFGEGEDAVTRPEPTRRIKSFWGLQGTVPDTLGYDQKTAAYTLEEGGFRVRVSRRKVSTSREEGIVVQQLPRGGITRRIGWTVTIVVGIMR
jgi:hypothetical protein